MMLAQLNLAIGCTCWLCMPAGAAVDGGAALLPDKVVLLTGAEISLQ
jgi:hypothetical protein